MGNICYFGTQCDSRTHSPTPPPTRRPTTSPVPFPTVSPTFTMLPTSSPTFTTLPTDAPSEQGPTQSPTPSPTKRPTFPPMPTLQATFFCGTNWDDAITNCKRRCPTGESTECPFDEKCFSGTPCTEELGYPEDYGLAGGGDGSSGSEGGEACVPFKVTIVADHWPKETSWLVENTELGDIIAEGNNKDLIPGEPVEWVECVNNRNGCYEFTINDSGGDGMCCEHGNGSYKISYDGVELKQGSTFYDLEKTPFGFCGAPDTEQPTKKPTEAPQKNTASGGTTISGGGGKSGDAAYRCVPNPLAESGYEVSSDKCNLFVDCYNQYIDVGDDFFCDENSICVDAPGCGVKEDDPAEASTAPPPAVSSPQTNPPTSKVSASRPIVARPKPASKPASKPAPEISKTKSTPPTPSPVAVAVDSPTESPTLLPTTYRPTYGPCGGEMCNEEDHCRSRYGFCGPGDTYCNDDAIWTNDCPVPEPSPRPSSLPVSESPTNPPVTLAPVTLIPTASIPVSGLDDLIEATESPTAHPVTTMRPSPKKTSSGFKKPGGGKGSLSKPAKSHSPITLYPTRKPTPLPTDVIVTTSGSTVNPSSSPITMIGTVVLDSLTTASPSPLPTRPPSNRPTEAPFREPITPAPTHKAILKPTISLSEPDVDSYPSETQPEVDTTKTKPGVDTSGTNNVPSTVSDTSSKADEDEYDCAGEQCPVDTHCRSRYGSCGPGFIYCNLYSIWRNTCPPIVPGTRPTRTPTAKPTKSPESNRFEPSFTSTLVVPESTPTFPPLPKPSLPTIGSKQVTPRTPPSSFSDTDEGAESDQAENNITEGAKSDQAKHNDTDKPEPSASPNSNPSAELFQSAGYLHEWKSGHSNCAPPYTLLHPSYLMLLVLSLSCSLLYSILV